MSNRIRKQNMTAQAILSEIYSIENTDEKLESTVPCCKK